MALTVLLAEALVSREGMASGGSSGPRALAAGVPEALFLYKNQ